MNGKRLELLQACRGIAFIGIFISHVMESYLGSWGVSIFFVLSGFLAVYSDALQEKDTRVSLVDCIRYAKRRVDKLYWLHILILLPALAINLYRQMFHMDWSGLLLKAVPNLLLLQSWFPDEKIYFAFNSVAWFLSTSAFIWFVAPIWLHGLRKADVNRCIGGVVLVMLIMLGISFGLENFTGLSDDAKKWFTYIFPPVRLLDFFAGGYLGKLFLGYKPQKDYENRSGIVWDIGGCGFVILSFAILLIAPDLIPISYRTSIIWLPGSLVLVWISANEKGVLSKLLSAHFLIKLGNISQHLFLIHQIVIRLVNSILGRVIIRERFILLFAIVDFGVSVFVAAIIEKCVRYKKLKILYKS